MNTVKLFLILFIVFHIADAVITTYLPFFEELGIYEANPVVRELLKDFLKYWTFQLVLLYLGVVGIVFINYIPELVTKHRKFVKELAEGVTLALVLLRVAPVVNNLILIYVFFTNLS